MGRDAMDSENVQCNNELEAVIGEMKKAEKDYLSRIQQLQDVVASQDDAPLTKPYIVELEEMAMAHAQRNNELEGVLGEMKQAELGYLQRIAELQDAPHADAIVELEEMAVGYAQRIEELEGVVGEMKQAEQHHLSRIAQLQDAASVQDPTCNDRLRELEEVAMEQAQQNTELNAMIGEMREAEQDYLLQIQHLREQVEVAQSSATCDEQRSQELKEFATAHAQRSADLEAEIREMKHAEEEYLSRMMRLQDHVTDQDTTIRELETKEQELLAQIAHLQSAAAAQLDAPQGDGIVDFEEMAKAHAQRNVDLEVVVNEMKQAEQDYLSQIAQLQKAAATQDEQAAAHARHRTELEAAMVGAMKQTERDYESQLAQLQSVAQNAEAEAAAHARCNSELQVELGGMRQAQRERDAGIAQLKEELAQSTAAADTSVYTSHIADLEATVAAHAQRNAELEAVIRSMQDREARIAQLEEALAVQMQHNSEDSQVSANELANYFAENKALKAQLADAQEQLSTCRVEQKPLPATSPVQPPKMHSSAMCRSPQPCSPGGRQLNRPSFFTVPHNPGGTATIPVGPVQGGIIPCGLGASVRDPRGGSISFPGHIGAGGSIEIPATAPGGTHCFGGSTEVPAGSAVCGGGGGAPAPRVIRCVSPVRQVVRCASPVRVVHSAMPLGAAVRCVSPVRQVTQLPMRPLSPSRIQPSQLMHTESMYMAHGLGGDLGGSRNNLRNDLLSI